MSRYALFDISMIAFTSSMIHLLLQTKWQFRFETQLDPSVLLYLVARGNKEMGGEEHAGNFIDTIVLRLEPWICNPENQLVISLRMIPLNSCTCAYMLVRSLMTAHHTINKKSSFKDTWFSKYGMTSYLKIKIWIISFTLN